MYYTAQSIGGPKKIGLAYLAQADLSITKTDSPDPVIAGNDLTYTITVKNNSPSDATGVVVTDTLPSGVTYKSETHVVGSVSQASGLVTWNGFGLSGDATATLMITVTVDSSTMGSITNDVTVSGNEIDPYPGNNAVTQSTTVNSQADLSITEIDNPDPVVPGNDLTYTIMVKNNGPSDATSVVVTDTLPIGVTYKSEAHIVGSVSQASGVVTWNGFGLVSGAMATITITVTVSSSTTGSVTNGVTVSGNETDPYSGNNT